MRTGNRPFDHLSRSGGSGSRCAKISGTVNVQVAGRNNRYEVVYRPRLRSCCCRTDRTVLTNPTGTYNAYRTPNVIVETDVSPEQPCHECDVVGVGVGNTVFENIAVARVRQNRGKSDENTHPAPSEHFARMLAFGDGRTFACRA